MAKELVGPSKGLPDRPRKSDDITASRDEAVDRVFRGGLLGTAGLVSALTAEIVARAGLSTHVVELLLVGGGVLAAGIGFTLVGRALPHLRRFGGRRGVQLFGSAAAFGIGAIARGISSVAAGILGWSSPLMLIADIGALGMVVAGIAMLVIFVAGVLFGWTEAED